MQLNEISKSLLMTDPLIYPCLVLLMKLLHEKQTNKNEEFFTSHLLVKHFIKSKSIFQDKFLFYQNMVLFYQQTVTNVSQEQLNYHTLIFQNFNNENLSLVHNEKSICEIVAKIISIGLHAVLQLQINTNISYRIIHLCEDIHMTFALEGISISQVLLKFIPTITNQIKNLTFYEHILKIFLNLDYYQVINFLEKTILKFREDWQKNQQKLHLNISKKNRQSFFLPSAKKTVSLQQKEKSKQKQEMKQNHKSVQKNVQKTKQNIKSNFKKVQTTQKVPPSSRRRTFYQGNRYQYNGRVTNSDFHSSIESVSFQEPKMNKKQNNHWANLKYEKKFIHATSQSGMKYLENQPEDILAGNTPKRKKMEKKK